MVLSTAVQNEAAQRLFERRLSSDDTRMTRCWPDTWLSFRSMNALRAFT
jgi:hypothetical protein